MKLACIGASHMYNAVRLERSQTFGMRPIVGTVLPEPQTLAQRKQHVVFALLGT
jgi:hypothetical protein